MGEMMSDKKTNVMRILDKNKMNYEVYYYQVDEEHLDAITVAEEAGIDLSLVYKTLVLQGNDKNYYVAVINGADELDLKKTAKAFGLKSIDMIAVKEINKITGYIRGGCSPVGMKKQYKTVIDKKAEGLEKIVISAGQRGIQLKLSVSDLVFAVNADFDNLIK